MYSTETEQVEASCDAQGWGQWTLVTTP
jgi:hypothetical protein